jgi:hypothetical protein
VGYRQLDKGTQMNYKSVSAVELMDVLEDRRPDVVAYPEKPSLMKSIVFFSTQLEERVAFLEQKIIELRKEIGLDE